MIYTTKVFREEVSPEDVINTPTDIKAELDEIEKAICGPDGIEAHRDEVEDAETGLVGEPLEEAYTMIYEAEYNYNQIMKCIGINELKSYSEGNVFVFTEADTNGFFTKIKDFFRRAFERVTEWFHKLIKSISDALNADKQFVKKHADVIKKGYESIGVDETIDSYEFKNLASTTDSAKESNYFSQDDPTAMYYRFKKEYDDGNTVSPDHNPEMVEKDSLDRMGIYDLNLGDDTSMKNLSERLTNYLRGQKTAINIKNTKDLSAEAVIARMGSDMISEIKHHFATIKKNYADRIELIEDMHKFCKKENPSPEELGRKLAVCEAYVTEMRHDLRVENIKCGVYMSALRARAARDRVLARKYYNAGKDTPKTESAPVGSVIFSSLNFV